MTAACILAGAVSYVLMRGVGRTFAFAFALLTAAAVPIVAFS